MKFPIAVFALITCVGVFFAGAILALGSVAGCNRSGIIAEADASAPTGACPDCPPDLNPGVAADCTQQNGIDTLTVESFDRFQNTTELAAQDLYSYTDGTAVIAFQDFHGNAVTDAGFEPPVVPLDRCKPPADAVIGNGVLHMFGGPFLSWGGGIGVAMQKLNGSDPGNGGNNVDSNTYVDPNAPKGFCCVNQPTPANLPCRVSSDPKYASTCPPANAEFAVSIGAIDVSQYEGVSFWARRGYTGQAGIRVNVGDKYTDDDLNYLAQRQQLDTGQPQTLYCQRVRECACRNHQDCSPLTGAQLNNGSNQLPASSATMPAAIGTVGGLFCGALPAGSNLTQGCVGLNGGPSLCCESTACDAPYPAFPIDLIPDAAIVPGRPLHWPGGDPQFYGRPCTPYAYANGVGSLWCYDPARDPPPAPSTTQCGDHWESVVTLDTDWQFYKVPFTNMHQQGFAQKSEHLDLHSVSVVRFTWDVGYVDDWIDEVSFYRASASGT